MLTSIGSWKYDSDSEFPHHGRSIPPPRPDLLPKGLVALVSDLPNDPNVAEHRYRDGRPDTSCTAHIGQRKLLMSEIQFLTETLTKLGIAETRKHTVVYAGAAHGFHIPTLLRMFRGCFDEFHLYDIPDRFCPELRKIENEPNSKIRITPVKGGRGTPDGYFDDHIAKSYSDRPTIFISDLRTETDNASVLKNTEDQERWFRYMQATCACLKYRTPFAENPSKSRTYQVPAGKIVLQVWAPSQSAETRLWIFGKRAKKVMMDINDIEFETAMNVFNTYYRSLSFKLAGGAKAPDGTCTCYDHMMERLIISRYILTMKRLGIIAKTATASVTVDRIIDIIESVPTMRAIGKYGKNQDFECLSKKSKK